MATNQRDTLHFPLSDRAQLNPYLPPNPPNNTTPSDLPHVTLTYASSLDSALSLRPGTQTALSGPHSKAMTHYLRSTHDAILIGVGTAVADDPSLNCRLAGVGGYGGLGLAQQPRPVVLDPRRRWVLGSGTKVLRLAREGRGRAPWVVCVRGAGAGVEAAGGTGAVETPEVLAAVGGEVIALEATAVSATPLATASATTATTDGRRLDWITILRTLKAKGVHSVMIEGGANVINALLAEGNAHLVSSVIVTIAPTWLGQGGVVVSPERCETGPSAPVARLRDVVWRQLGEDVVLCGRLGG